MPLPILQKLLGHSSIKTTALYWRDIYGDDDDPNDILAGKNWLESREPPKPPTMKNFPEQLPTNSEPIFIANKPPIPNKKLIKQDNSLSTKKITARSLELINEISPKTPEKFFLGRISKKDNQLEISQSLALINSNSTKSTEKEQILLTRIKQLEERLKQVQTENSNLKLENKHLKALIRKDQATEAKIIHSLPWKARK